MGRTRTFREEEVLTHAMHAFRRDGFTPLSITGLERATGLRVSSLYNAFGDKATLYQRAVEHYLDSFVRPRLTRFAGPEATLEDLEQLLTSLLDEPLNDGYGCLVTNAVLEYGGSDGPAAGLVRSTFDELQRHAEDVVRREIGTDAAEVAARVVLLYQGLLVFSRAGYAGELHRAAVRDEFTRLRAQRDRINETSLTRTKEDKQ